MVLTRAGTKRALDKDSNASENGTQAAKKTKPLKKAGTKSAPSAAQQQPPKTLLTLPAEIRNRIYHYASERDFDGWANAAPLVSRRFSCCSRHSPVEFLDWWKQVNSARNFFGLTQVCKQIRAEYRPIWLRNSTVRLRPGHLELYLHTFYGCHPNWENDHMSIPKQIQISWDDDMERHLDILSLLRMRAACSSFKAEFIPDILTHVEGPWTEHDACELCMDEMEDENIDFEDLEYFDCPHDEVRREAFAEFLMGDEYSYLWQLNDFLSHDNAKWRKDIRDKDISRVDLNSAGHHIPPAVRVHLNNGSAICNDEHEKMSISGFVTQYIQSRELDSEPWSSLRFQMCFMDTGW